MTSPSPIPAVPPSPPENLPDDPTLSYNSGRASLVVTAAPGRTDSDTPLPVGNGPLSVGSGFVLHRVIGRGGHGEVWEGEQTSLGRVVAIKRVRPELHLATSESVQASLSAQFRAEALVTASLEHPNIVPVYELQTAADGQPHLVMKLVRGRSWRTRLRQDRAEHPSNEFLARHLAILIQVCHAVAFAHDRGIVHRDLKPSQVMLGEYGEVLLMDWGLALAIDQPDQETTDSSTRALRDGITTQASATSPSGTPVYMAPEQTLRTAEAIGRWTDIYLLGGMLYELLTGHPPHHATTSDEAFRLAADGRVMPPHERAPDREIPRELEAVAMKALSLRPTDRHGSVVDFRIALEDFLSGANRRREATELIAQADAELPRVAGDYRRLGTLVGQINRALVLWPDSHEAQMLRDRTHAAFAEAALREGDLRLARVEAERIAPGDLRAQLLARVTRGEMRAARRGLQRKAAIAATILLALALFGGGYLHIKTQREAQALLERSNQLLASENQQARLAREDAESLLAFMVGELRPRLEPMGQLPLLSEISQRALDYFERQPDVELNDNEMLRKVAVLTQASAVRQTKGDLDQAEALIQHAYSLISPLSRTFPEKPHLASADAEILLVAGSIQQQRGELLRALDLLTEADSAIRRTLLRLPGDESARGLHGAILDRQGDVLLGLGRIAEAAGIFAEAREVFEGLVTSHPGNPQWAHQLARVHAQIGYGHRLQGDLPAAEEAMRVAVEKLREVVSKYPANIIWRRDYASLQDRFAGVLLARGKPEEAGEVYEANVATMRGLVAHDPTNGDWRLLLAIALNRLGTMRERAGDLDVAHRLYSESLSLGRELAEQSERNIAAEGHMAWCLKLLGRLASERDDSTATQEYLDEALGLRRRHLELEPRNRWWRSDVAQILTIRAEHALLQGETGSAEPALTEAAETWRELLEEEPLNEFWINGRARALWALSRARSLSRRPDTTPAAEALTLIEPLALRSNDTSHLATLVLVLMELGRASEAAEHRELLRTRGHRERWLQVME